MPTQILSAEYIDELIQQEYPELASDLREWCVTEIVRDTLSYIVDNASGTEETKQLLSETYALAKDKPEAKAKFDSIFAQLLRTLSQERWLSLQKEVKEFITTDVKQVIKVLKELP
jgi:hypothetical protein